MKFLKRSKTRILLFFAVVGPGFITANVDNDAGGIFTYSQAGAQFGYDAPREALFDFGPEQRPAFLRGGGNVPDTQGTQLGRRVAHGAAESGIHEYEARVRIDPRYPLIGLLGEKTREIGKTLSTIAGDTTPAPLTPRFRRRALIPGIRHSKFSVSLVVDCTRFFGVVECQTENPKLTHGATQNDTWKPRLPRRSFFPL